MPVTSGVAPVFGGADWGWSGKVGGTPVLEGLATGRVLALALMDCSTCFHFQTQVQPSPRTMRTKAAVRRILPMERPSSGSDPGASTGAGSGFSSGWGKVSAAAEGFAAARSSTATDGITRVGTTAGGTNFSSTMIFAGT